jgi:phospholipase/carboxylesterase
MMNLPLRFLHQPARAAGTDPWLLVLMHGIGSNADDLFSMAPHVPPQFHVLSLQAPYAVGPQAWAWFEISVTAAGRVINDAQEESSRQLVAGVLESAAAQLGVAPERVVVGGFSQGGIMSLSLLLSCPQRMRAAMVMHSRLLEKMLPLQVAASEFRGKSLWVSHGTSDNMIPLASAQDIRDKLSGLPLDLRYTEFPGAHEIRPAEFSQAMAWLNSLGAANGA